MPAVWQEAIVMRKNCSISQAVFAQELYEAKGRGESLTKTTERVIIVYPQVPCPFFYSLNAILGNEACRMNKRHHMYLILFQ